MNPQPGEHLVQAGTAPLPMILVLAALALTGWGGWYLGTFGGGFRMEVLDPPPADCSQALATAPTTPADPLRLGRRVYASCAGCHQPDGGGVPGLYPPLTVPGWIAENFELPTQVVLHGVQGPLEVGGTLYDQPMPAWRNLTDEQIAAVLSYVRASWGNDAPQITVDQVAHVRHATSGRKHPYEAADLQPLLP